MNPRWRDDPSFLLETVRAYLLYPPAAPAPQRSVSRREAEVEAEAALRRGGGLLRPVLRPLYRTVLQQAREFSRLRENSKSLIVKMLGEARRLFLEVGHRLAERGILAGRDDVFFLEVETGNPR